MKQKQLCGNCSYFKRYDKSEWGDCASGFKVDNNSRGLSVSTATEPKLIGCDKFKSGVKRDN